MLVVTPTGITASYFHLQRNWRGYESLPLILFEGASLDFQFCGLIAQRR